MKNKPIIAAILTMVVLYLLISFAAWELNAKNWVLEARVLYAIFSPIISLMSFSIVYQAYGGDK
jgi:hypothetical protein